MNSLSQKIEGLLFYNADPTKVKDLVKILESNEELVFESLEEIKNFYGEERGVRLLVEDGFAQIVVADIARSSIEKLRTLEIEGELSKASLETLTIVAYMGLALRAEVDYIRGVNSSHSLRILSMRGLIEKVPAPGDARQVAYKPTIECLRFLGLDAFTQMPDYEKVRGELEMILKRKNKDE